MFAASSSRRPSPVPAIAGAGAFRLQVALFLLALLAMAFWPRADAPLLLIPIGASSEASVWNLAASGGADLMGEGWPRRSIVVAPHTTLSPLTLLHGGVLAVAASPALCGTIPATKDGQS